MGQGIGAALVQLVAEAVEVDRKDVRIDYPLNHPKGGIMVTVGSINVGSLFDRLDVHPLPDTDVARQEGGARWEREGYRPGAYARRGLALTRAAESPSHEVGSVQHFSPHSTGQSAARDASRARGSGKGQE